MEKLRTWYCCLFATESNACGMTQLVPPPWALQSMCFLCTRKQSHSACSIKLFYLYPERGDRKIGASFSFIGKGACVQNSYQGGHMSIHWKKTRIYTCVSTLQQLSFLLLVAKKTDFVFTQFTQEAKWEKSELRNIFEPYLKLHYFPY